MRIPRPLQFFCAVLMSMLISNVPSAAIAQGMISTSQLAAELSREEAQANVQNFLSRDDVRNELVTRGIAPEEVSARLANLSEAELRQLSGEIQEARAGGDILITILVVVL